MTAVLESFPVTEQKLSRYSGDMADCSVASPSEADSPTALALTDGSRPSGPLTRVWEPPPRPKPGRKPATDTPPSKRKAQNRQAQRNFRERRAQKINELEALMEHDRRSSGSTIDKLNTELTRYRVLYEEIKRELHQARTDLRHEIDARIAAQEEAEHARAALLEEKGAVPLRPRNKARDRSTGLRPGSVTSQRPRDFQDSSDTLCGRKCELGKCTCVDDMIVTKAVDPHAGNVSGILNDTAGTAGKERFGYGEYSQRFDSEMEVDMTTRRKLPQRQPSSSLVESANLLTTSGPGFEDGNCGFCDDSSVCPCRDFQDAAVQDQLDSVRMREQSQVTDTSRLADTGCSGNPGSCSQCQRDPMSKDFCVSFAKQVEPLYKESTAKSATDGSCGVTNCCRITSKRSTAQPQTSTSSISRLNQASTQLPDNYGTPSMDCAAAYTRLKKHPNFTEAMANKGEWMRRLRPIPTNSFVTCDAQQENSENSLVPSSGDIRATNTRAEGMTAYEIDAASVMATFRHFDTRFGRDSKGDWKKEYGNQV